MRSPKTSNDSLVPKISPRSPLLLIAFLMIRLLHGQDLVWDGDVSNAGLQDGGGEWNITDGTRWFNSTASAYETWDNASPSVAVFGVSSGGAGTIMLNGSMTAAGLRFDAAGSGSYTLSGGTLNLSGTPVVTANVDAAISSILDGENGLTKNGVGILTLNGATTNTLTGTIVNVGTLTMNKTGGATAVAGNIQVNAGGTLLWGAAGQVASTSAITVAGGIINFGNRSTSFASYAQTSGGQTGTNAGTIAISGTLAMSGGTVLTLNSGGQWSAHTVDFTGYATAGNALLLASDSTTVITRFTVGEGGLTLSGQNLTLNRATTAGRLGNELVLNGDVTASGTNVLGYGSFSTLAAGAVNQLKMESGVRTWNVTAGTTTVNLATAGNGGLTKTGNGTLILSGGDHNAHAGLTTVNGGTLTLNKVAGINAIAGDLLVSNGTLSWLQHNQIADDATLTVNGGLTLSLGGRNETFTNYTQTAGLGFTSGSGNSGMVNITGLARVSGGGAINVNSGGQMTANAADFTGSSGTAIVVGGSSTVRVSSFTIGAGGLTLSGQGITLARGANEGMMGSELILNGGVTASGNNSINTNTGPHGVARVNLGASVRTFNITAATTTIAVPLVGTGGVLKTGAGTLTLNAVNTYEGKTTVSQGSLRLGAAASISSSSWVQIDSGAVFDTSTISGGHSFSGGTVISGGGGITGSLIVGGTSQLRPGGTSNSESIGTAGDGVGTLAVSGSLSFTPATPGTVAQFQILNSTTADRLTVGGNLTLNASSNMAVVFDSAYSPVWGDSWELIDWGGVLTEGGFSIGTNLRSGMDADLNEGNLNLPDLTPHGHVWEISQFSGAGSLIITIVPEPSRVLLLAISCAALVLRRKRLVM